MLRVMLNMLRSVMKASETKLMTSAMNRIAMKTQKGWVRIMAPKPVTSCRDVMLSSMAAWSIGCCAVLA